MVLDSTKKIIDLLAQMMDSLNQRESTWPLDDTKYRAELAGIAIRIANADGFISSQELRVINYLLGLNLYPGCANIREALSKTESDFLDVPPLSTAAFCIAENSLGVRNIASNNWESIYTLCYAVAMASGGKGGREESYLNHYFDKLLACPMIMGVSTHPRDTIDYRILSNIQTEAKTI